MADSIPIHLPPLTRCPTVLLLPTSTTPSYIIDAKNKSYKHQYANIYFTRLTMLRKSVEERAKEKWESVSGNPVYVHRVLEIIKSQLCWVLGTVYMDMPLKPNVLDDIGRDHSIPAPPPPNKIFSDHDSVMLEDESGRIKLVGDKVNGARFVTGVIVAALGMETPGGEFEVIDLCTAGLAPFAEESVDADAMEVDDTSPSSSEDEYLAVISGLSVGAVSSADSQIQMLIEFLSGEIGGPEDQKLAAQISRLIIAGNSLSPVISNEEDEEERKPRRFGAAAQVTFSSHPNIVLSNHLHDLASVLPIHILPGADDPAGAILPQQPFPRAMFGGAAGYETFCCESNPTWLRIQSGDDSHNSDETSDNDNSPSTSPRSSIARSILATSGQPVLDMYKYLPTPPSTLLSIAASTLRWRHVAPSAPDTLWCHPYRERDPFVLQETPDIYLVGGMPQFSTGTVTNESPKGEDPPKNARRCRIVLIPNFAQSGVLVLVNLRTLGVRLVNFGVEGMSSGSGDLEGHEAVMEEG
ncbi:hypothetical protein BJ138DRAFT_1109137 [Hygrophoropsis aurantiaca]|uniref:Uncharacterized protein n=1 Tax=Hygrophoropsis aurantiaca TaxID=72124 RepID=A0ACB8ASS7_9AGAM|nr:hypothetical protein BJ138DRAFT_1109137 [Hygrophoropsis aurantiaca]